jgi:PAS domain S-box-containing protein
VSQTVIDRILDRRLPMGAANSHMRMRWLTWGGFLAVLILVQYLAVRLGLLMGIAHGNVSPVWPATGIAIAFLLRFGIGLWPGLVVGSFIGLLQTGVGTWVATGEAAAALLEALTAVWLVRYWTSSEDPLSNARDVIYFCILAGGIATAISATVGVASLSLGGVVSWKSFGYHWGTWWLGDMMGALIIAPFLIIWTSPGHWQLDRTTWFKTATVFAFLFFAGVIAFWGPFVSTTGVGDYPIAFLTVPMVVYAAFLAGRRGATTACLIYSVMAISGTAHGLGPFFRGSVNESLLLLQSYLVVISVTSIILAAVLKERDRAVAGIQRSHHELENRIAERTQELVTLNTQLTHEIVDRKHAEQALRKSQEMLSLALDGANQSIWDWDLTTGKALWIEQALQLLGYEPYQFEANLKNWKKLVYPEDWPKVSESLNLHMEGKLPMFDVDYRILNNSGDWQWVQARGKIVAADDNKKPTRMTGVFSDATARKKAEEERRNLLNQITQAQKMEAIGTLAGGIAHDFNNLLTIINGYSELILSEKTEENQDYTRLHKILETGLKGAELVRRLLAFSKINESSPQPLDLNHVVEDSIALIQRTFPKMIEVETILEKDLGMVNADAVQLEQVLMNLSINAKEAMSEGGILRIQTKKVTLDADYCRLLPSAKPGQHALVEISDTGVGINKEIVDRVFDPFFTTKGWDYKKGTGLGLSVAKGIVEQHGGCITCESKRGQGTIFRVYLPIIEKSPVAHERSEVPKNVPSSGRILLIDDEEYVRDLGKRILERAGYTVITSSNGTEALEIYEKEQSSISLVILDLIMPQMAGEKCLEELRKIDPTLKVVISSGHSLDHRERNSLEAQVRGFINKPYQIEQFLETIRAALVT